MSAMFKKKSSKRNFRRKFHDDEDGEQPMEVDETEDGTTEGPTVFKKKEKTKVKDEKVPTKAKLLSFEHDEEPEETFKLKKSKESKRLAKRLNQERKHKQDPIEIPEDKEIVLVQKRSISKDAVSHKDSEERKEPGMLAALRLELSQMHADDDIPVLLETKKSGGQGNEIKQESGSGVDAKILIPDAATIHAARKRRELARQGGPDFIPIDDTQKYSGRFEGEKSRLVREDENDGSDEDDERINFSGAASHRSFPALERRSQVTQALEENEDHDEHEDEELQRWEEEQIRKGVSIPQSQDMQDQFSHTNASLYANSYNYDGKHPFQTPENGISFNQTTDMNSKPPLSITGTQFVTVDLITEKLNSKLFSLQEVHRMHRLEKEKLTERIEGLVENVSALEQQAVDVERKFGFYQEMRGYVRDMIECLNEKVSIIDELEKNMHNLLKQRVQRMVDIRQQDIKDQAEDCLQAMSGKKTTVTSTNDEFGRDKATYTEQAKQRRTAEREGRKNRRRRKREQTRMTPQNGKTEAHHEGMSTDDEEAESEISRFQTEKGKILTDSHAIFNDVVEEFSSLVKVKAQFEKWKFVNTDTYNEAYISLCLPKILAPFVRLELLEWDPLEEFCPDFEDMSWFQCLMFYGSNSEDVDPDDPDLNLVPSVVEKTLLTKLVELVENWWDPMSSKQSAKLVQLMKRLIEDYPTVSPQNKATQVLFQAVVTRIKTSINDDVYVPLYPKQLLENKSSGALNFFHRQFWGCFKLFSNILLWSNLLSQSRLQELSVDSLLNRYLLLGVQHSTLHFDNLEKVKAIVSVVPKSWLEDCTYTTHSCLEPLARYLYALSESFHKSTLGCGDHEKKKARSGIKKVITLLIQIKAMDKAKTIAKQHSLEEFVISTN